MNYYVVQVKTGRLTAGNLKNQSGDENSELNAADENASTISNASTNMSYQDLDSRKYSSSDF